MKISKLNIALIALSVGLLLGLVYYADKSNQLPIVETKVVEKNVQAEIPEEYITAMVLYSRFKDVTYDYHSYATLVGLKKVSVHVNMSDVIKDVVSESEIRTKIELTLRRSGLLVDDNATHRLVFSGSAIRDGEYSFNFSCCLRLYELGFYLGTGDYKPTKAVLTNIQLWDTGAYGSAGKLKISEGFVKNAESFAESFVNDWMAANPKETVSAKE